MYIYINVFYVYPYSDRKCRWISEADLYKKQHLEFQRAEAAIRSIMSQPEHAQRLLDEHDPASVARSAALGELPSLGRIKWKGPILPENYMPPGGISKGLVKKKEQSEELVAV